MPKRSNLFQDVVAIVHRRLAGDATVTESAELTHRLTGRRREVDVVIDSTVASHTVTVSIEATKGGRRATVEWVERMVAKHEHLPTDKLVLVSEAGFTKQARELALREFALPVEPEATGTSGVDAVVEAAVERLWPKLLTLAAEAVTLSVRDPATGQVAEIRDPDQSLAVVYPDLREAASLVASVQVVLNALAEREYVGWVRDVSEDVDGRFTATAAPLAADDGEKSTPLGLRFEASDGTSAFHPIVELRVEGTRRIRVREVPLVGKRIAGVDAKYGEYDVDGQHHGLVITSAHGREAATLRVRASESSEASDYTLTPSDSTLNRSEGYPTAIRTGAV